MNKFKIGIVGNGFVGSAICKGLNHYHDVKIYDINETKSAHPFEETIRQDIVFVCLPTPMFNDTLSSDTSYVVDFFNTVITHDYNSQTIFVIKSTVPIGTTDHICKKYKPLRIVHSPEFLTARSAAIDFITPSRNIVGGEESEFVKYFANSFFATKVSFFNEMFLLSNKLNLSWDKIVGGVMSDGRIGISHYQVPGHDGDFGFGGTCFPKDINAFIDTFENEGIDPVLLKAVWNRNLSIRKNKDWEKSTSAVTQI